MNCVVRVSDVYCRGLVLYIPLLKLPMPLTLGVPSHLAHVRATLSGEGGGRDHSWIFSYSTLGKSLVMRARGGRASASRLGCQEVVA